MIRRIYTLLAWFLMVMPFQILAHARFTPGYPLILRNPGDNLKNPDSPCGGSPTTDLEKRSVFRAGQQVEIFFEETVDHPSKYQIAFSPDATDSFSVILMDEDDIENGLKPQDLAVKQDKDGPVKDRIKDPRIYRYIITLPETPCDFCALRLTQRMYDQIPPSDYFSCADIRILPGDSRDIPPEKPAGINVLKIQVTR